MPGPFFPSPPPPTLHGLPWASKLPASAPGWGHCAPSGLECLEGHEHASPHIPEGCALVRHWTHLNYGETSKSTKREPSREPASQNLTASLSCGGSPPGQCGQDLRPKVTGPGDKGKGSESTCPGARKPKTWSGKLSSRGWRGGPAGPEGEIRAAMVTSNPEARSTRLWRLVGLAHHPVHPVLSRDG